MGMMVGVVVAVAATSRSTAYSFCSKLRLLETAISCRGAWVRTLPGSYASVSFKAKENTYVDVVNAPRARSTMSGTV